MENSKRSRYWTIIIFKDNWEKVPNWKEILIDTHIRFCVSPLHDLDTWSELDVQKHSDRAEYIKQHIGEPKNPHFHVMLHCDDNTTFKTIKEIIEPLGCSMPLPVVAPDSMYSYFTHEFNPEKAQYNANDITHYNGSDPSDYIMEISKFKRSMMIDQLDNIFVECGITKYYQMLRKAAELGDPNYLFLVQTNTYHFKQILVDVINEVKQKEQKELDKILPKGRRYDG